MKIKSNFLFWLAMALLGLGTINSFMNKDVQAAKAYAVACFSLVASLIDP